MKRNDRIAVVTLAVALLMGFIATSCEDTTSSNPGSNPPLSMPAAPRGLVSLTHNETSIAIAWNAVTGANKYHVYAGTEAGNLPLVGSPTSTSYLIIGLTAETTYYIEVSAENQLGESDKSAAITVTTTEAVKPAAPTGLTAGTTITEASIAISWNSVSGAVSYNVFAGATVSGMTSRGNPTETNFTITELSANTAYYIAVSARTAPNESDQSTSISVVTLPSAPTGLVAGTIASDTIAVTWTGISGVTGYTVYAGTTSGNMTQRGTPPSASFTITGLTANTMYYIAVSARNASGGGSQSSPITATTKLPAPGGVIATPQAASNSIQVSWNAISGAVSYRVYRSSGAAGTYTSIGTTTSAPYNDTNRTVSTPYYYKVSAVNNDNIEGELSGYVSATISAQTKTITSFRFADFSVNGTINGTNITVTVPNIVNLTTLVPTIDHNGRSIAPASGVAQNFSSSIQYTVTAEDNTTQNYTVTVNVTNTGLATAFAWINNYNGSTRTFTIVARESESLAPITIDPNYGNTNIIFSGGITEKIISLNTNGSLFTISYGTLTLDNNITLQGRSSNNASLVKLNYYSANLVMNTGSRIINNTAVINYSTTSENAIGGGVYIGEGTFTMNGGTISGNRVEATSNSASYSSDLRAMGGGIYVEYGTFIMNNGTISGNTAYSNKFYSAGGGVYIGSSGTFTLINGTISGNTAESSSALATSYTYGGGVAAWSSGIFTMQGGTISGNTVSTANNRLGGGVYVRNDSFRKTGGTIYGNDASPTSLQNTAPNTNSGYAVYVSVGSTTMRRNSTAGTYVNLDSSRTGNAGGWE